MENKGEIMLLPIPDYTIVDFEKRQLAVVAEATTKKEAVEACKRRDSCEVYKEQGEEIYRCICQERTVISHEDISRSKL